MSDVPTTKILAIGSMTAKATPEAIASVLPFEVRATVRDYLAGKIEQWFFQTERQGVVFIMNATSPGEAHDILEKLPLGVAGMMIFDLRPNLAAAKCPSTSTAARLVAWLSPPRRTRNALQFRLGLFK